MIVEKNSKKNEIELPIGESDKVKVISIEEAVRVNPMIGTHDALKEIISSIKENPNDPNSEPYFKTIKVNNGQLARIKGSKLNEEYGIVFPAVFIHFINVHSVAETSRVFEQKATVRIHYILNNLNNSDGNVEYEGYRLYNDIVNAIENNKHKFPALVKTFKLMYWDQPLTFDDGLQPYWIEYDIAFNDYSSYIYKNYIETYLTQPPFTQPSDQNSIANSENLPDWTEPKFEDVADFDDFD